MSNRILIYRALALASNLALAGAVVAPLAEASQAQGRAVRAQHAVAGEVKKIDHAAKTLALHTADGIDETIKFTGRTVVRGIKDATRAADATAKASLEGASVVLYYTGEGVDKTAISVDHIGKRTLKLAKGTVVGADAAGKFVVVKTATGAEETFELTKDVVVDSGRGVEDAAVVTGGAIKKGAEVTMHYSEEGGKKVVLLVKHL
jgi:Cu/Ag efflux protein CusF